MKKLFGFIMAIFIAIALSACGKQEAPQTTNPPANAPTFDNNVAQPENTVKEEDAGIFASIRDAINKSIPLKCTYTDTEGMSLAMYIKGNAMRADAIQKLPTDPLIHEIFKDNKVYIWTDGSQQGMVIDSSKMQPGEKTTETGETSVNSAEDIVNNLEQQKQNCVQEIVSDSIFEVPTNVTFMEITQ
jgi:hypothetical protein